MIREKHFFNDQDYDRAEKHNIKYPYFRTLFFGKEKVMAFCECNIWKYRKRALDKNGREDMQKADVYVKFYKALYDGKDVHYYLKPESCDSK